MKARAARTKSVEPKRRIELPELFDQDADAAPSPFLPETPEERCVLVVARSAALKNFLVPIFRREGCLPVAATTREEVELALAEHPVDHILVAQDMMEDFSSWIAAGALMSAGAEVSILSTVSGTLLDNPAPYGKMLKTVFGAVQVFADERAERDHVTAPYALVTRDIRELCKTFRIRRIASDGAQLAAWLLAPAAPSTPAPFRDFARSLELARALNFPWRIDVVLEKARALFAGEARPGASDAKGHEVDLAAQILALAWYRHAVVAARSPEDEDGVAVKGRLRAVAGRLASLEVVEAYGRQIESAGKTNGSSERRVVVMVTTNDDLVRDVVTRFGRQGLHVVPKHSMADARPFCETSPPAAVVVDFATLGMEAARLSVVLRLIPNLLLYALVEANDPSITLDLIDAGFDDVLAPPLDFDVVAARISRATRGRRRGPDDLQVGFRGTFAAFSFVDLIQSLAQSRKSVRIDLQRGDGEAAVIYLEGGRLTHASAGTIRGNEAVYHVIAWADDGSFTVEAVTSFPAANIADATEAVLMEGCRLLDESHAAR